MIKTVKKYLVAHEGNSYKPHLLRERSMGVLACLAFVLFCTSLGSSYLINKTDFGAAVLPAVLVDLTNQQRLAVGGKALKVNANLEKAALMKAKDMADNQYFAHTSPTGVTPWQWFSKAGYRYSYAGENLAINFTESIDVENAWIASPTHLANLISDKFDETGIATYQGTYQGQPTTFVVQLFGRQPQSPKVTPVSKAIAATVPTKTETPAPKVATVPEVKGESLAVKQPPIDPQEPAPVLLVNEPLFAVAQNLNENDSVTPTNSEPEVTKYSTLAERLLVNQGRNVQYIYLIFIIIIYLVLMGMILVEFHRQHPKNIALAILLLCFLGVLAYLNSSFVLSFV
jgi:hypothetical protein